MAKFQLVAELADEMAGTGSRLVKRARIAETVRRVHEEGMGEEGLFCLYLAGLPFAESDGRKLNAGGALLSKVLKSVTGAGDAELTAAYRRHGDMGAGAFDVYVTHELRGGDGIPLAEVAEAFAGMAVAKTTAIRAGLVEGLLRRATPVEAKYLLKLMLGDMRIGVKESLVEEGIATAAEAAGLPTDVAVVRHAVMLEADLGRAAGRAFAGTLGEAKMTLFHPLGFMLASPVETPEEAIERFTAKPVKVAAVKKPKRRKKGEPELDEVMVEVMASDVEGTMEDSPAELERVLPEEPTSETPDVGLPKAEGVHAFLEDKFDGMRAQVHCGAAGQAGRVAIYSRSREDVTEGFPELVEAFAQVGDAVGDGLILDGEILGWDFATGQALPFAVLGQRIGRKRVGDEIRTQIPVVFMTFDLMYVAGELMLGLPLRERRNRLEAVMEALVDRVRSPLAAPKAKDQVGLFEEPTHRDDAAMNGAHGDSQAQARLMISPAKLVESADEIERAYSDARARANEGVMLKAAGSLYQPGRRGLAWVKLKRTLDTLDVVVTGAEYGSGRKSQFLSDYTFAVRDENGELKNVGKAYSGVTDAEITELTEFFKAHTLEDYGHFRSVEPLVIFEVGFNNVMRSDRHASGFALRFPRIIQIRRDKPLEEIDTVARVEEIYQSQVDKPVEAVAGSAEVDVQ